MSATRILWGQILVVFALTLAGVWAGTQWTAYALGYQAQLGAPWFSVSGAPVYPDDLSLPYMACPLHAISHCSSSPRPGCGCFALAHSRRLHRCDDGVPFDFGVAIVSRHGGTDCAAAPRTPRTSGRTDELAARYGTSTGRFPISSSQTSDDARSRRCTACAALEAGF